MMIDIDPSLTLSLRSSVRLLTEYIIYFYKKVRSTVRLVKKSYYTLMRLINKLGLQSALGLPS